VGGAFLWGSKINLQIQYSNITFTPQCEAELINIQQLFTVAINGGITSLRSTSIPCGYRIFNPTIQL